jgi:hypothetical protein
MNKAVLTILVFMSLLLFIFSPFASLASLMIFLLVTAFLWTFWTVVQVIIGGGNTKSDSP